MWDFKLMNIQVIKINCVDSDCNPITSGISSTKQIKILQKVSAHHSSNTQ